MVWRFMLPHLSIVDLQRVELSGIFDKVRRAPFVSRLFLINGKEIIQSRVLVVEFVQFVSSDGGAHSAPRPEHPVPSNR